MARFRLSPEMEHAMRMLGEVELGEGLGLMQDHQIFRDLWGLFEKGYWAGAGGFMPPFRVGDAAPADLILWFLHRLEVYGMKKTETLEIAILQFLQIAEEEGYFPGECSLKFQGVSRCCLSCEHFKVHGLGDPEQNRMRIIKEQLGESLLESLDVGNLSGALLPDNYSHPGLMLVAAQETELWREVPSGACAWTSGELENAGLSPERIPWSYRCSGWKLQPSVQQQLFSWIEEEEEKRKKEEK